MKPKLLIRITCCLFVSYYCFSVFGFQALAIEKASLQKNSRLNSKTYLALGPISNIRRTLKELSQNLNNLEAASSADARLILETINRDIVGIIKEIDQSYSSNLERTVDSLKEVEKIFFRDVEKTIFLTQDAVSKSIDKGTSSSIKLLREASISSYDTLFSLPCRNKTPRLVYSNINQIEIGKDEGVVKIRGNFLNIGSGQKAQINGKPASLIAINSNEISIKIPDSVIASISTPETVSVSLSTNKTIERKILICQKKIVSNDSPLSVAISLTPQISYKIDGFIGAKWEELIPEKRNFERRVFNESFDETYQDCDADEAFNRVYSIPTDWTVVDVEKHVESAGGNSDIEKITPTEHTVTVLGRIRGKGYSLGGLNCNGRGWLKFRINITAEKVTVIPSSVVSRTLQNSNFNVIGKLGQTTFGGIRHEKANDFASLRKLNWSYGVTVRPFRGSLELPIVQLSSTNPDSGNIFTKLNNGEIAVDIK